MFSIFFREKHCFSPNKIENIYINWKFGQFSVLFLSLKNFCIKFPELLCAYLNVSKLIAVTTSFSDWFWTIVQMVSTNVNMNDDLLFIWTILWNCSTVGITCQQSIHTSIRPPGSISELGAIKQKTIYSFRQCEHFPTIVKCILTMAGNGSTIFKTDRLFSKQINIIKVAFKLFKKDIKTILFYQVIFHFTSS